MARNAQDAKVVDWSALLQRHPIFEAIGAKDKAFLLSDAISKKLVLDAGEIILRQGETGNSLFVVCDGSVSVTLEDQAGDPVRLHLLTEGEVFGEMALFGQQLRSATLTTVEPSKLLEIPGDEFLTLMKKHSEVAFYFLAKLTRRLTQNDNMILANRMTGIDSSVLDLKNKLEIVSQTTEAKLSASQTMFDQTNTRANEIIESAGRARTRLTAMLATGGTILSLVIGGGLWQLDKTLDKIEGYAEDAEKHVVDAQDHATEAGKASKSIAMAATQSQLASSAIAQNVQQLIEKSKDAEEAIERASEETNELFYGLVLKSLKQNSEDLLADPDFDRVVDLIEKSPTKSKSKERFYDYMYEIALGRENGKKIDLLLKTAIRYDTKEPLDSLIDFRYFASLSYIAQDIFDKASEQQQEVEKLSRNIKKNRLIKLYSIAKERAELLEYKITLNQNQGTKTKRLRMLKELHDTLKVEAQ